MSNPFDPKLNRRQFLRQTFAFSALAATAPAPRLWRSGCRQPKAGAAPDPNGQHMFLIGDWGTDKYLDQQTATALAMKQWVDQRHIKPESLFLLGDNWYGDMGVGYVSGRWQQQFEQMYPDLAVPGSLLCRPRQSRLRAQGLVQSGP